MYSPQFPSIHHPISSIQSNSFNFEFQAVQRCLERDISLCVGVDRGRDWGMRRKGDGVSKSGGEEEGIETAAITTRRQRRSELGNIDEAEP
ncbi:hypothetical protein AKJ16_DCAP27095, partial [Drosera capensis]